MTARDTPEAAMARAMTKVSKAGGKTIKWGDGEGSIAAAILAALDGWTLVPSDWEEFRKANGWPTPNHMRRVADALDVLTPAKYGDILRWVADATMRALAPSEP